MEHTVKQLKSLARERGLRRYSALRKAELINLLSTGNTEARMSLLDRGCAAYRSTNANSCYYHNNIK